MSPRDSDPEDDAKRPKPTLAEKLNHLLSTVPVAGEQLTSEGLARAVSALGSDHKLSADYVRKLRRGEMNNPTVRVVEGIAKVFGVRPSYFTDNDEETVSLHTDLALAAALRDKNIRSLALRTSQLSASSIRAIMDIVHALDDGTDDARPG